MTLVLAPSPPVAVEIDTLRSLYIHIPFCERKCEYCDFVSQPGREGEAEYVGALRTEIRTLGQAFPEIELETIFVGGGTPSLIEPSRLAALLGEVRAGFRIAAGAEITLEANPSSTTEARASAWLEAGFNRVSLGVQSLEPDILGFLGRVHDPARALAAVGEVRRAGFVRVNCDLIYGIPGLDDERWQTTLRRIVAVDPGHVSAYELTVEPGTPLHASVRRGAVTPVDAEPALRQHWLGVEILSAAGYAQYEVSNFARPGQECRHNLVYWARGQYLAAGVGAHGHLAAGLAHRLGLDVPAGAVSIRYWHARRTGAYVAATTAGAAVEGSEPVDAEGAEVERVMLGLRLAGGVEVAPGRAADELVATGLLERRGNMVRATRRGQEVLDEVIRRLTG